MQIIIGIFINFFFVDINPHSKMSYAAPLQSINFIKLLLKTVIIIMFELDYEGKHGKYYILVLLLMEIIIIIARYR